MNGGTLRMALPIFRANDVDHYVIVVEHGETFMTIKTDTLDSSSYWSERYFRTLERAVRDAYIRADVHLMPWDEIHGEWAAVKKDTGYWSEEEDGSERDDVDILREVGMDEAADDLDREIGRYF